LPVGFTLGPVGGGGSILTVPLMVYLVGVTPPHLAIGTSALAVAVNAAGNLVLHAQQGTIKWRCAGMYALAVVAGAFAGSSPRKAFDGQKLLFLLALLMLVLGVLMLRGRGEPGNLDVQCRRENALKVIAYGSATGLFSGFFGISGGFLIAPGLMAATGLPMIHGVGSSLVAVAAFGLTTAINYAASGFIDWGLARRSGAAACLAAWSARRHRSISWCTRDCSTACSRR
jgi:uncharacterized membrane protein YfcA